VTGFEQIDSEESISMPQPVSNLSWFILYDLNPFCLWATTGFVINEQGQQSTERFSRLRIALVDTPGLAVYCVV